MALWKQLQQDGEGAVRSLCEERAQEGQQLEFKRKRNRERAELEEDDRKGLGESLSGFSNATGGIVLFGIISEKGPDGFDAAREPQLLANIGTIASKIRSLIPEYLSPPNPDIEVLPILFAEPSGAGIIAIRVGASNLRPHMSLAPSHRRYYQRVEASNLSLVHYQVRDLFLVGSAPFLNLRYCFEDAGGNAASRTCGLVLRIANDGPVSAKGAYLSIPRSASGNQLTIINAYGTLLQTPTVSGQGYLFRAPPGLSVHPEMEIAALQVGFQMRKRDGEQFEITLPGESGKFHSIDKAEFMVRASIGCDDLPRKDFEIRLRQQQLEEVTKKIWLGHGPCGEGAARPIPPTFGET